MKLQITSIVLASVLLASFSGCSNQPNIQAPVIIPCTQDGIVAPNWTCSPANALNGSYTDFGSANFSNLGLSFSRKVAMANARSNISHQIKSSIKDKVELFSRSTGLVGQEVADQVFTNVSQQIANITLNGSKQIKFWQHPENKSIFILVAVNKKLINDKIESSYKSKEANWIQSQADIALEKLKKEVE